MALTSWRPLRPLNIQQLERAARLLLGLAHSHQDTLACASTWIRSVRQIPQDVAIEPAGRCERKMWKPRLRENRSYVADRNFGHDYNPMRLIGLRGSWFVFRLQSNTYLEAVPGTQRPLSQADRTAGVISDPTVLLGKENPHQVRIHDLSLDLITNRLDFPAEFIALAYKYRWQVELFFRWLKCLLGCEHWLAESPQGVAIRVYCALIAAVRLALWTGKRPTKRAWKPCSCIKPAGLRRRICRRCCVLKK